MTNMNSKTLRQEIDSVKFKFKIVLILFVIILVGNGLFFYRLEERSNNTQNQASEVTSSVLSQSKDFNKDYQNSITSFYNNNSVSEVGYQLELKKQSISTKNTTNCFTVDAAPSIQNGCGFVVRPYADVIKPTGTKLLKLVIKGEMGPNDKVQVDLKNSDKNELSTGIGTIEGKNAIKYIDLPASLQPNEQIQLRLWPQRGSSIIINELQFEYFNYDMLLPVTLKFSDSLVEQYKGRTGKIAIDTNKSGEYEPESDELWTCKDNFPGVKNFVLETNTIQLKRDDVCVVQNQPPKWSTDNGNSVLATYQYFVLIGDGVTENKAYPLQVNRERESYDI
jgi:hypothetical protein